jgi:hypothetical protein
MEQALKRELLCQSPEGIEGKEDKHCGLPNWTPTLDRKRDQRSSHQQRARAHGYQAGDDVVPSKAQIAPGVGTAADEIEDVREQR